MATELGMALADQGHEVHFISYKQPARLDFYTGNVFYHEVGFMNYPLFDYPPYELALVSKLVDVMKFTDLDLLHVHYAIPHAFAASTARQIIAQQGRYVPVITTLHGTDITLVGKDSTYEPAVTFSINQSDAVTAVSNFLKEETYRHFDVKKDIHVFPNFVDFARFHRRQKEHFKQAIAPGDEKVLVHISNFRKVKRVEDVIHVFNKVREKVPSKLLMIGDGPERAKAERTCRELTYCGDVRFLGKIDAVEEVLSIADLFLLPSTTESFGLAALEAMACEVPVISSNAGGLPEVNIHGETGFVTDIGDVENMARFALRLLKDGGMLEQFKKQALARAKQFDLKNILPQYLELYESLVKEKASNPPA